MGKTCVVGYGAISDTIYEWEGKKKRVRCRVGLYYFQKKRMEVNMKLHSTLTNMEDPCPPKSIINMYKQIYSVKNGGS